LQVHDQSVWHLFNSKFLNYFDFLIASRALVPRYVCACNHWLEWLIYILLIFDFKRQSIEHFIILIDFVAILTNQNRGKESRKHRLDNLWHRCIF
jgi:hypothetical protein